MSSKKFPITWPASPHTIAKISILRSYLYAYFQILGRTSRGADILYLDGFAGPGEYTNPTSGSPVAAVEAAIRAVRDMEYAWEARAIFLGFIEIDKKRVEHLKSALDRFENEPEVRSGAIRFRVFEGSFVEQLAFVRSWCPMPFQSRSPLFAFIDPFGATGVTFSVVRELLKSPCSEIFLNLDADGITRLLKARKIPANSQHLDAIFDASGIKDSWHDYLDANKEHKSLFGDVLALYKSRLHNETSAKYVFSFQMSTSDVSLNYHLVFASGHPLGLKKMKEAMKVLDQDGTYRFLDTNALSGQSSLFRFDEPVDYWLAFFNAFKGQNVAYSALEDWALNESPFLNPKSMLGILQTRGLIRVNPNAGAKLQRGGFPEEKIASIDFAPARNVPFPPKR